MMVGLMVDLLYVTSKEICFSIDFFQLVFFSGDIPRELMTMNII